MKIAMCSCKCGTRLTRKASRGNRGKRGRMRFAPGHSQVRRESMERKLFIYNARKGRKSPAVRLFNGKRPMSLRRTGESQ